MGARVPVGVRNLGKHLHNGVLFRFITNNDPIRIHITVLSEDAVKFG
jgi:hypothetical protein